MPLFGFGKPNVRRMQEKRDVKKLCKALKHNDATIRKEAATVLGEIGDGQVVQPLIAALEDTDEDVREQAVSALGEIGDSQAAEPLIAAFKDHSTAVQGKAAEALLNIGGAAVEALVAALTDGHQWVRQQAAKALGEIRDPRAVEPLCAALKDTDEDVRERAVEALGKIGDPRAIPHLLGARIRGRGCQGAWPAARQIGLDERAIGPLRAALNDPDECVRRETISGLEEIGAPHAMGPLCAALNNPDELVRQLAAQAQVRMANADLEALIPALIAALKESDGDVRAGAAKALGNRADVRAVEPLIAALKDSDGDVRAGAAKALGNRADVRAVEPLIAALKDSDEWVRDAARESLAELGDVALEPLIALAQNDDNALEALHDFDSPAAREAIEKRRGEVPEGALQGERVSPAPPADAETKGQSPEEWAERLEERKDYRALAAVFNSTDRSPEFAKTRKGELARKVLATAGSEAVPGILEELETGGVGRLELALILVEIDDPRAVLLLKTQLDRGAFDAYGSKRHIVRFVERHPHLHGPEEMVQCALCGKTRPAAETSGYHHEGEVKRFCIDTCWSRRGQMVGSKLGAGCPYYSDGMCAAGAGDSPCSLQVGDYTTCHVYALVEPTPSPKQGHADVHLQCAQCNRQLEAVEPVAFARPQVVFTGPEDFAGKPLECFSCKLVFCFDCAEVKASGGQRQWCCPRCGWVLRDMATGRDMEAFVFD